MKQRLYYYTFILIVCKSSIVTAFGATPLPGGGVSTCRNLCRQNRRQCHHMTTINAQQRRAVFYDDNENSNDLNYVNDVIDDDESSHYYETTSLDRMTTTRTNDGNNLLRRNLQKPITGAAPLIKRRNEDRYFDEYKYEQEEDDDENDYNDDDDDYDDDDDVDDEAKTTGNFWSNPNAASMDRFRQRQQLPRRDASTRPRMSSRGRRGDPSSQQQQQQQQQRRRSTFRSGTPPPPAPFRDFYNKLFWYGVNDDSDDINDDDRNPADPTMFGGTKGKFNGLAYLKVAASDEPDYDTAARRQRRRRPATNREDASTVRVLRGPPGESRTEVTPPDDPPNPWPSTQQRRRRNAPDWPAETVSSWFDEGDDNDLYDDDDYQDDQDDERYNKQQQQSDSRKRSSSPLWKAIDSFLGLDRQEMQRQATWYNDQMGIDKNRQRQRPKQPIKQQQQQQRRPRPGYLYAMGEDDLEDETFNGGEDEVVVDVDPKPVVDGSNKDGPNVAAVNDDDDNKDSMAAAQKKDLSWQERAAAVERVPPAGIPAWGPSGELDIDARTKSILDALEDVVNAKLRVSEQEKLVELAKEQVSVLRVEAQLTQRRLEQSRQPINTMQNALRKLDFDVEEASRKLRLCKSRLSFAKEELADLEARHWAVLSFYNPDVVAANLADAFRELEESEPAVKQYKEEMEASESSATTLETSNEKE
ncbi:hypothetical protein MPSEU_000177700 [Mayamaea pseudoterrestris]|nr:hypothetical protein MPSEU_000177700 [Mayamaea pseudoterrestris]